MVAMGLMMTSLDSGSLQKTFFVLQYAVCALVLMHAAAALHHHFFRHNNVRARLLPGLRDR
jgi:cytochrome b561